MDSIYLNFELELDRLCVYLDFLMARDVFFNKPLDCTPYQEEWSLADVLDRDRHILNLGRLWQESRFNSKIYDYNCVIICLYGLFEGFFRAICRSYLEEVIDIFGSYNSLPKNIADSHFNLSLDLAKKWSTYGVDRNDVVNNLAACLSGSSKVINFEAFLLGAGNLKHVRVCEIMNSLGIDFNKKITNVEAVKKCVLDFFNGDIEGSCDGDLIKSLVHRLEDIVDRRNEVAHGAIFSSPNIVSLELVKSQFIFFIKAYVRAILECMRHEVVCLRFNRNLFSKIEIVHQVINHNIVCFSLPSGKNIKIDDYLVIQDANGSVFRSKILEIQIDRANVQRADSIAAAVDIGCRIDQRVKETYNFYLEY